MVMVWQKILVVTILTILCQNLSEAVYRGPVTYERISKEHDEWLAKHGYNLYQAGPALEPPKNGDSSAVARERLGKDTADGGLVVALNQQILPGRATQPNTVQEHTVHKPKTFKMDPNYQFHIDELFGIETTNPGTRFL